MADPKYWSAYAIVPLIVLANIIFNMNSHIDMGILIQKKTKYLAYIDGSNGVLILGLNFLLIWRYGIYGAAFAKLIAFIFQTCLYYYFSSRIYKIYFEFVRIGKMLGCGALLLYVCSLLDISNVYAIFAIKSVVVLCFPGALWLCGFFYQEEKAMIREYIGKLSSRKKAVA